VDQQQVDQQQVDHQQVDHQRKKVSFGQTTKIFTITAFISKYFNCPL